MTLVCVSIVVETVESALEDADRAKRAGAELVEYRIDGFFQSFLDQADTDQSPERQRGVEPARGDPSPQPSPGGRGGEQMDAPGQHSSPSCALSAFIDLVARSPMPCIITCRIESEGGAYTGADADRAVLFQAMIDADFPPCYIDIELASLERSAELRQFVAGLAARQSGGDGASGPALTGETPVPPSRQSPPRIILSTHDFDSRPTDLSRRLARMRETVGATILKVAHRARSLRDNLELFEIVQQRDRPTIALGMGKVGLMSRVLAPKFGAFLTFASLRDSTASAPGQPTIGDLLNLYRFRSITPETKVFGVIGFPVGHSLSPMVHSAGFDADHFDGVYLPMPVPTEWEHFKATFGSLVDDQSLDFTGASVTLPHKEHLIRFAQERADEGWRIDPLALAAGAANTAARGADGWLVANTDAPAVVASVRIAIPDLQGTTVLILGAGGVARSAAAGLVEHAARVVIANRTRRRAQRVADDLAPFAQAHGAEVLAVAWDEAAQVQCAVVVNATSVGMAGGSAPDRTPIDLDSLAAANSDLVVFDTVYNPQETPLLAAARRLGLRTVSGHELFVRQAEMQYSLWTGGNPPAGLFERLVRQRLG